MVWEMKGVNICQKTPTEPTPYQTVWDQWNGVGGVGDGEKRNVGQSPNPPTPQTFHVSKCFFLRAVFDDALSCILGVEMADFLHKSRWQLHDKN